MTRESSAPDPRFEPVVQELYGISLRTPWPVRGVAGRTSGPWDVEFVEGDGDAFSAASRSIPPDQQGHWATLLGVLGEVGQTLEGLLVFIVVVQLTSP